MATYSTSQHPPMRSRSHKLVRQAGVTLIELMVALVLGLLLIGGVVSVVISTQQNFKTTENLSRLQEGARFAFEQMGREIREAGATPCGVKAVSSLMRVGEKTTPPPWWSDWDNGTLIGYKGDAATTVAGISIGAASANRVANTDAILTMRLNMDDGNLALISAHDPASKSITVNSTSGFDKNDVVLACDNSSGAIFQIDNATGASMGYTKGESNANCTDILGWPQPSNCSSTTATKTISPGGFVAKYDPAFWYIGVGSVGGSSKSLYRTALKSSDVSSVPILTPLEMVTNVDNLKVEFLTRDKTKIAEGEVSAGAALATEWVGPDNAAFAAASGGWSSTNTKEVVAVRLTLTFNSPDAVGTDGKPLVRETIAVIGLRNREVKS